jgi:5'-nucleotidase
VSSRATTFAATERHRRPVKYHWSVLHPRIALVAPFAVAVAATVSLIAVRQAPTPPPGNTVDVQLLAFNDFHGNLDPPSGSNGRIGSIDAGGVEYFATHLARLKSTNPNTLVVSAGDLIGASPLLSGLFHDEPTIEALNKVGLDISSVGNHEFDEGWAELYRMQHGGCHPTDGCRDHTPFSGAAFPYLSANVFVDPRRADKDLLEKSVVNAGSRSRTLFPAYAIREIGGVKIGFIGMTLEGTPQLVQPTGVAGLIFKSEADTANDLIPILKRQHVRAIVVLVHEGGFPSGTDFNGCPGVSGAILQIARRIKDDVDVIVSGHTHQAYNCTLGKKLVTSAASYGRLITSIDLKIDKATDEVVSKTARNVIVTRDVPKSAELTAILDRYRPLYEPLANRTIGTIARDITRAQNAAGESALGDVAADAMLEATRASGGAVLAFMNTGGIRADLTRRPTASPDAPSPVSYSDAFNVHPVQNRLVVKTFTGDMIKKVIEQQFDNRAPNNDMVLQVSDGFTYSYDRSKPRGSRVNAASMMLGGQRLDPKQKYRVAISDFLSDGGDNFTVFTQGTEPFMAGADVEALAAYIGRHSPAVPGPMNRIVASK